MSPQTQLRWTIIAALLMWSPVAYSLIFAGEDMLRGGLLFIAALVVSYIGLSVIAHLINSYQRTQHMVAQAQKQIEMIERRKAELEELDLDEQGNPRRRAGD